MWQNFENVGLSINVEPNSMQIIILSLLYYTTGIALAIADRNNIVWTDKLELCIENCYILR